MNERALWGQEEGNLRFLARFFVVEYLEKKKSFSHRDVRKRVSTRNSETNGIKVQLQLGS